MTHRPLRIITVAVMAILFASCNITEPYESESDPKPPDEDAELQADFTHSSDELLICFTNESSDEDDSIVEWEWRFGDGESSNEQHPCHDYATPGDYDVTLIVTNDLGKEDEITKTVTVSEDTTSGPSKPEVVKNDCSEGAGAVEIYVDGGVERFDLKNLDTGSIIRSGDNIDKNEFSFSGLMNANYRFIGYKNDQQSSADFSVDCVSNLSNWKTHQVTFDLSNDSTWVSDTQNRLYDEALAYGEVRPILTDAEPVGTVEVEVRFTTNTSGEVTFALNISEKSDGSNVFQTPEFTANAGDDSWVKKTVEVDASHFSVKQESSVKLVHGDAIRSDLESGPDTIQLSSSDTNGKITFRWRTEKTNTKANTNSRTGDWESIVTEDRTDTRVTN